MRLNSDSLHDLDGRVPVPGYDRAGVRPGVVHIGVGGFHRAHQAMYLDSLLELGGAADWGIVGAGLMERDEAMRDVLTSQDCLYTLVVQGGDGRWEPRVIGSMIDYVYGPDDPERLLALMADPGVRIVSLTVTEGGYHLNQSTGEFDPSAPEVAGDLAGAAGPRSAFGYITQALARRRRLGIAPFTVMSCDNIQGNGDVARRMITAFAELLDPGLAAWIRSDVAFPNSMVDRITPVTRPEHRERLSRDFGIDDGWPVVCEPFAQWVLEDTFVQGRPSLEAVGVTIVDDVVPYEMMKLRLLNVGHQAIAYLGWLMGYRYAHEAAADPDLAELLRRYMDREATPTLRPVPGVDLEDYKRDLVQRFANPGVRDTLARLCAETSDRIPTWLVPVIRHNLDHGGHVAHSALIVASWARYAEGVDELGRPIAIVDRRHDAIVARAERQRAEPLAFLEAPDLFADLSSRPGFTDLYADALRRLHERGARDTLRSWLSDHA